MESQLLRYGEIVQNAKDEDQLGRPGVVLRMLLQQSA